MSRTMNSPLSGWSPLANKAEMSYSQFPAVPASVWWRIRSSPIDKKGFLWGLAKDFGPKVLVSLECHDPKIDWTKEQL